MANNDTLTNGLIFLGSILIAIADTGLVIYIVITGQLPQPAWGFIPLMLAHIGLIALYLREA